MMDVVIDGELSPKDLDRPRRKVQIVVPETALFSVNADWCSVMIPASDVIRGMHIIGYNGDMIFVVSVSVRDNIDSVTPTA